jgi:hypothetical protein
MHNQPQSRIRRLLSRLRTVIARRKLRATALLLCLLLVVLHPVWLPLIVAPLTTAPPARLADVLVTLPHIGFEAEVARRLRRPGSRIIVPLPYGSQIQRMGLYPSLEQIVRTGLAEHGVDADACEFVATDGRTRMEVLVETAAFLEAEGIRTADLSAPYDGARTWQIYAARASDTVDLRVQRLPPYAYRPARWWRTRSGIKFVCLSYIGLCHAWLFAGTDEPVDDYDWDALEEQLRQMKAASSAAGPSRTTGGGI